MLVEEKGLYGGTQALYRFDNGYGASVVRHSSSYGGKDGLYELGVTKWEEDSWELTYETPITGDVIGYLDWEEVEDYLRQIEGLTKEGVSRYHQRDLMIKSFDEVKKFAKRDSIDSAVRAEMIELLDEIRSTLVKERK